MHQPDALAGECDLRAVFDCALGRLKGLPTRVVDLERRLRRGECGHRGAFPRAQSPDPERT